MADFAKLVLDADTTGLKKAEGDLKSVSRTAGETAKAIGSSMQKLGLGLTAGVTAPLALFGKGAAQAAIDAEEMDSAFGVVFGNMADDVREWARVTGDALGRSTQEVQRGALAFQELFGKALDPAQAAEMSKEFAVLTQDLASFKNLSNEVAQQKLFSGLVGESEPLRAVGVFINDAAVQAKALELGIAGVNGTLTDQEKIVARAALIQDQLASAQGDVLRTSESTANEIKRSQAAFEELQVTVGTKLLPVLTPLIEKLGAALEWFTSLPAPVQDSILVVAGLSAALGPVLTALGTIVTIAPAVATAFGVVRVAALALMTNPVILGFAAVLTGIYLAWQNWDKITAIVQRLYTGVKTWLMDKLGAVFDWLRDKIKAVTGFFFDMYDAVVGNSYVPDMVEGIGAEFARLQTLMVDPAQRAADDVKASMSAMASEVSSLLSRLFPEMEQARRLAADMATLRDAEDAGLISGQTRSAGLKRLLGDATVSDWLTKDEPLVDFSKQLDETMGELERKTQKSTTAIGDSFGTMADRALQALDRMVGAIRGGGFFDILNSVIGLGLQLGGMGVFGKSVQTSIRAQSFDGGGFTGSGARSGGVDGKGGFMAVLHPNETVIDHTKGQGQRQSVVIINNSALAEAFVDERIVGAAPAIMQGSAQIAQSQASRAARRRVA